jgi:hypothetical protein
MVAPVLAALAPEAVSAISRLLDRIIPDPAAKAKALLEAQKEENAQLLEELRLTLQADQMQADINKVEAANANLFVSGWRPFVGWVCGAAFAYHYVIQPLLAFLLAVAGKSIVPPQFDMEALITVLFGLLGLGGLRTFEKIKGAAR